MNLAGVLYVYGKWTNDKIYGFNKKSEWRYLSLVLIDNMIATNLLSCVDKYEYSEVIYDVKYNRSKKFHKTVWKI